jgi:hypothetical protein
MIESIAEALETPEIVGKQDLERDWHKRVTQRCWRARTREIRSQQEVISECFSWKGQGPVLKLIEESSQYFIRRITAGPQSSGAGFCD